MIVGVEGFSNITGVSLTWQLGEIIVLNTDGTFSKVGPGAITVSSRTDIQTFPVQYKETHFIIENDPALDGQPGRYTKTPDGRVWLWAVQVI